MLWLKSPPAGLVPGPRGGLGLADQLPQCPFGSLNHARQGTGICLSAPSSLFWLCCPGQAARPSNPAPPAAGWPPSRQPMDAASQADHTCHSRWFKIPPNPGKPATWSFSSQANVSLAQELGLSLAEPAVRDHGQVGKQIAPKILGWERLSAPAPCGAVDWVWEGGKKGGKKGGRREGGRGPCNGIKWHLGRPGSSTLRLFIPGPWGPI